MLALIIIRGPITQIDATPDPPASQGYDPDALWRRQQPLTGPGHLARDCVYSRQPGPGHHNRESSGADRREGRECFAHASDCPGPPLHVRTRLSAQPPTVFLCADGATWGPRPRARPCPCMNPTREARVGRALSRERKRRRPAGLAQAGLLLSWPPASSDGRLLSLVDPPTVAENGAAAIAPIQACGD